MRTALLTVAALGLSVAGAYACPAHDNHVSLDKDLTVASIAGEQAPMSTVETVTDEGGMIEPVVPVADEAE